MRLIQLEYLLALKKYGSVSAAAEHLFVAQPTISIAIKDLERELNYPLILRSKGFKQIELTQEGMDFVPIAERMVSLWKETKLLQHNRDRKLLNVGCTDSVNVALLAPFYRELLRQETSLDLNIRPITPRSYMGSWTTMISTWPLSSTIFITKISYHSWFSKRSSIWCSPSIRRSARLWSIRRSWTRPWSCF